MIESVFYAKPSGDGLLLRKPPQLASWDALQASSQGRLRDYLDDTVALIGDLSRLGEAHLALSLDVGLPANVELLGERDLDNYLLPIAVRLSPFRDRRFVSFWATKAHADHSFIRVEPAVPASGEAAAPILMSTEASSGSEGYKHEIRNQLLGVDALPDGPVHL